MIITFIVGLILTVSIGEIVVELRKLNRLLEKNIDDVNSTLKRKL